MSRRSKATPFYDQLSKEVKALGGMFNAHLHLDRSGTLDDTYMADADHQILENSHISLQKKHSLINALHSGPAYQSDNLASRINDCLDVMVEVNTRRADSLVDVTDDAVGHSALDTMLAIKQQRQGELDLQVGAYSPLGFKDSEPRRWDIFEAGAYRADFIAALPEADDKDDYPENIGFTEHCRRMLELARALNKPLHVHTDQRNEPGETGTERLIEAIRQYGAPESSSGEPMVWAVHMISPSTYDEDRFQRLVNHLVEFNIGVICCPSAAIGMRQLRPLNTPTYNSIPRVLELLTAGVRVRLASDNIADICSPSTTADLIDEIFVLSAALRFYQVNILAKLATGTPLNDSELQMIKGHLEKNSQEINMALHESH